jgi:hypothetical protein
MLSRTFMSYGLLDGHGVRFANAAEPFPIAYTCKIYGGILFNAVVIIGENLRTFSMVEISSRSRHASWTLIRLVGGLETKIQTNVLYEL